MMKKIVAVLISALAALSIVLVAFVGTQAVGIEPIIYITSVTILDMDRHPIDSSNKTLQVNFSPDAEDEDGNAYMFYVFNAAILPETSTSRAVLYYCPDDPYFSFVSSSPSITEKSSVAGGQTSRSGQLLIKNMVKKDPSKAAYHVLQIHLKAADNGQASEDWIYFVVKY